MTEINQKILDMILKNASANEIAAATGLSNKQLFYRLNMLKIKGYEFERKYYYDGEIVYKLINDFKENNDISLLTRPEDTEFKAIFISDLHISNKKERVDLLNQIYDFCIKEGIHIIINGGDLIDGLIGFHDKKIYTYEEQIEYALKIHPYDKNILNFICLGNHDYTALEKTGQNLEKALLNKRHDIISLGYGFGRLKIKNDEIIVTHPKTPPKTQIESTSNGLMLTGHTHKSKNIFNGNLAHLYLPSLTNMKSTKGQEDFSLPGFIKATIDFNNGIFNKGVFEQFVFLDKMYKVNESQYELFRGKNIHKDVIKNEEERTPYEEVFEKVKTFSKKNERLSPIDKFNKKYNR